jgi:hypothetical protein
MPADGAVTQRLGRAAPTSGVNGRPGLGPGLAAARTESPVRCVVMRGRSAVAGLWRCTTTPDNSRVAVATTAILKGLNVRMSADLGERRHSSKKRSTEIRTVIEFGECGFDHRRG